MAHIGGLFLQMAPEDPQPSQPDDPEETIGTPEEIAALRARVEELRAVPGAMKPGTPQSREWRRLSLTLARMSRRKVMRARGENKMHLARATVAERIARRATLEAAGILEDSARVLRAGVNIYGRIASQELAEYLRDRLANGDPKEKKDAAAALIQIYQRSLDLLILNRQQAKGRGPAIASWPSEGEKT